MRERIVSFTLQQILKAVDPDHIHHAEYTAALKEPFLIKAYGSSLLFGTYSSKYPKNHTTWMQKVIFKDFVVIARDKEIPIGDAVRYAIENLDMHVKCDCPAFLYFGYKFMATKLNYLYGLPKENRPPKIRNPQYRGTVCKHSDKVMRWIVEHEEEIVRRFEQLYRKVDFAKALEEFETEHPEQARKMEDEKRDVDQPEENGKAPYVRGTKPSEEEDEEVPEEEEDEEAPVKSSLIASARLYTAYHGSESEFDEFDPSKAGSSSGNQGYLGKGIYLSIEKDRAGAYGTVKAFKVTLDNPFVINGPLTEEQAEHLNRGTDTYAFEAGTEPRHVYNGLASGISDYPEMAEMLSSYLEGEGFDGLVYNGGQEIVVFNPSSLSRIVESSANPDFDHREALDSTGFWGKQGAGALIKARTTGRFLVPRRSRQVLQPGTWGTWGGAIDSDEDPESAVRREVAEETGYSGSFDTQALSVYEDEASGFRYHNFLVTVEDEFEPELNWETSKAEWLTLDELKGKKLHFGLKALLDAKGDSLNQSLVVSASAVDINSPQFRSWFKDSVVVDGNGAPLPVYHFSPGAGFSSFRIADHDIGIHFGTADSANDRSGYTDTRNHYEQYKEELEDGVPLSYEDFLKSPEFHTTEHPQWKGEASHATYKVYLSIQRPVYMRTDPQGWELVWSLVDIIADDDRNDPGLRQACRDIYTKFEERYGEKSSESLEDSEDFITSGQFREFLVSKGYDGIVYLNEYEGHRDNSYCVFSSGQIKSALSNTGEFKGDHIDQSLIVSAPTADINSPQFRAWFGNSKVVDPQGKPLVVYHGTWTKGIESFKPGRVGAVYFTTSRDYARSGYGPNIYEAYLKIDKLADLTDPNSDAFKLMVEAFNAAGGWAASDDAWEYMQGEGETDPLFNPSRDTDTWELFDLPEVDMQSVFFDQGYDGFKLVERAGEGIDSYAVFSPTQVKSVYNKGTWDPSNPNINQSSVLSRDIPSIPPSPQLLKRAIKKYGITDDYFSAFFILPDGKLLSGQDPDGMEGVRDIDHHNVEGLLHGFNRKDGANRSRYDDLMEFMRKSGCVRVDFSIGFVDSIGIPNRDQIRTIYNAPVDKLYLTVRRVSGDIAREYEMDEPTPTKIRAFYSDPTHYRFYDDIYESIQSGFYEGDSLVPPTKGIYFHGGKVGQDGKPIPNGYGLVFLSPSRKEAQRFARGPSQGVHRFRVTTDNIFDGFSEEHLERIGEDRGVNEARLYDSSEVEDWFVLEKIQKAGFDGFYTRDYPVHDDDDPAGAFRNLGLFGSDSLVPDPVQSGFHALTSEVSDEQAAANFLSWFRGSKVVDYDGSPLAVYHGTTQEFRAFKRKYLSAEGDWGAGFYFSNTPEDVGHNYAGLGPDLENKIELEYEQHEDYSVPFRGELSEEQQKLKDEIRRKHMAHEGTTFKVYLRIVNPCVVGGEDDTFFDYEEPYNERTDTYGNPRGLMWRFWNNLRKVAGDLHGFDEGIVWTDIFENHPDGAYASQLMDTLRGSHGLAYIEDMDTAALLDKEILRRTLKLTGFDGIIDYTVDTKFGSQKKLGKPMAGMHEDTVHYVVFSPNQIKSVWNDGSWSRRHDIGSAARPKDPTSSPDFKAWFKRSVVVDAQGKPMLCYHGTEKALDRFDPMPSGLVAHFGSYKAAEERVSTRWESGAYGQGSLPSSINYIPVYLSIQDPVEMTDVHFDNALEMVEDLVDSGIFSKEEAGSLGDLTGLKGAEDQAILKVVNLLKSKGYDGIAYSNNVEDRGSMAYIPFSPDQIRMAVRLTSSDHSAADELAAGTEVELEHTDDRKEAREIARTHLAEDPRYYSKIAKVIPDVEEAFDKATITEDRFLDAEPFPFSGSSHMFTAGISTDAGLYAIIGGIQPLSMVLPPMAEHIGTSPRDFVYEVSGKLEEAGIPLRNLLTFAFNIQTPDGGMLFGNESVSDPNLRPFTTRIFATAYAFLRKYAHMLDNLVFTSFSSRARSSLYARLVRTAAEGYQEIAAFDVGQAHFSVIGHAPDGSREPVEQSLITEAVNYQNYQDIIDEESFKTIVALDPTPNGKLGKWFMQLYKNSVETYLNSGYIEEDARKGSFDSLTRVLWDSEVAKELTLYAKAVERKKLSPPLNNVMNYKSIGRLHSDLRDSPEWKAFLEDNSQRETAKEIEVLYEDSEWVAWIPKTYEASCAYGKGTEWCTATGNTREWWDRYRDAPLIDIKRKSDGYKWQLWDDGKGNKDWEGTTKRDKVPNKAAFLLSLPAKLRAILRQIEPQGFKAEEHIATVDDVIDYRKLEDPEYVVPAFTPQYHDLLRSFKQLLSDFRDPGELENVLMPIFENLGKNLGELAKSPSIITNLATVLHRASPELKERLKEIYLAGGLDTASMETMGHLQAFVEWVKEESSSSWTADKSPEEIYKKARETFSNPFELAHAMLPFINEGGDLRYLAASSVRMMYFIIALLDQGVSFENANLVSQDVFSTMVELAISAILHDGTFDKVPYMINAMRDILMRDNLLWPSKMLSDPDSSLYLLHPSFLYYVVDSGIRDKDFHSFLNSVSYTGYHGMYADNGSVYVNLRFTNALVEGGLHQSLLILAEKVANAGDIRSTKGFLLSLLNAAGAFPFEADSVILVITELLMGVHLSHMRELAEDSQLTACLWASSAQYPALLDALKAVDYAPTHRFRERASSPNAIKTMAEETFFNALLQDPVKFQEQLDYFIPMESRNANFLRYLLPLCIGKYIYAHQSHNFENSLNLVKNVRSTGYSFYTYLISQPFADGVAELLMKTFQEVGVAEFQNLMVGGTMDQYVDNHLGYMIRAVLRDSSLNMVDRADFAEQVLEGASVHSDEIMRDALLDLLASVPTDGKASSIGMFLEMVGRLEVKTFGPTVSSIAKTYTDAVIVMFYEAGADPDNSTFIYAMEKLRNNGFPGVSDWFRTTHSRRGTGFIETADRIFGEEPAEVVAGFRRFRKES